MGHPSRVSLLLASTGVAALGVALATTVGAAGSASALRRTPVVEAVARAAPAVVNVHTEAANRSGGMTRGSGSGVVVHPDGYVVTNSHVVRGAERISVETTRLTGRARQRLDCRVVEDDPAHDLALLKVVRGGPLPSVELRPTEDVLVGETAIAIGNPYNLGDSVTVGIVSALGRKASLPSGYVLDGLVQTDASINFGNSGGALLDLEGQLIGINSSVHPQAQGIAFSVPSDDVRALLDRSLARRTVPAPKPAVDPSRLAVQSPKASAPAAPAVPASKPGVGLTLRSDPVGLVVAAVEPLSPADLAGLRAGDVIVEFDGAAPSSPAETAMTLRAAPKGRVFSLRVRRGETRTRIVLVIPSV